MSATASKVIVFGATGAIGTSLIEIIHEKQPTWEILAVSRSGPKADSPLAKIPQVTMVKGDVEDLETVQELTKDVQLVFCTVGFPQYESKYWAKHWPVVVDNLLAVTNESRPLVFCDNLYAYGPGTNISPSSPTVSPSTKSKPAIRALLHQKFQERMDTLPKSIVVVGGADFFGPGVTNTELSWRYFCWKHGSWQQATGHWHGGCDSRLLLHQRLCKCLVCCERQSQRSIWKVLDLPSLNSRQDNATNCRSSQWLVGVSSQGSFSFADIYGVCTVTFYGIHEGTQRNASILDQGLLGRRLGLLQDVWYCGDAFERGVAENMLSFTSRFRRRQTSKQWIE